MSSHDSFSLSGTGGLDVRRTIGARAVPVIATPYNLSNLFSNIWPLYAVAIGQTFVLIIAGIDLSQGAIISLTSVIGASLIATRIDPAVFGQSPLWGRLLFEEGALLAHTPLGVPIALLAMLAIGEGAEQRAPMAHAVIGGLITSTILTLFIVPVVYTLLDDLTNKVLGRKGDAREHATAGLVAEPLTDCT